jgi:hypothetical protein
MKNLAPSSVPSRITGTTDADEFQLPLSGLYADLELGRGSIRLTDDFLDCPSLMKLELIRDWQRSLAGYRQETMQQFAAELTGVAARLGTSECVALLRSTCETLRIDVPTGFDTLITES